jgi:hypothetical protein
VERRLKIVVRFEELLQSWENHAIAEDIFHFFEQLARKHLLEVA